MVRGVFYERNYETKEFVMKYDFAAIEKKWQEKWEQEKPYAAVTGDKKPKFYGLIEFPYPSAAGLHVGHPRPFTAMDIICRKKRMQGYNVLNPIGFDAFGLPTENFAIKNHIHPAIVTKRNIENFTRQLKMLGYGFDWERVIDTTDPDYYRWTQWIFLQMYKHGLAYKTTMPVNWCTSCKCVLANEEVVEGVCERCGAPVVRKEKSQWMLRITKYADRLIDDLDLEGLDYIERVKTQQKNWIGRSTGTEVTFKTNTEDDITVYTTRVDTLFGVTYTVISPEHPLLNKWKERIANWADVEAYKQAAARKSDFERGELNKDKTGVRLEGIEVTNPATGKVVPMFVSDYVLMSYGTGIVMGVPGHDQRDWDFATKFGLPIVEVVQGGDITKSAFTLKDDTGIMVNSGFLNGMTVKEAIPAMKQYAIEQGWGHEKVNYKLRDWVFSRQRYWGEPIPMISCPKCGWVPVPEEQLPVVLPQVDSYEPTDDGESPLSKMTDWVNTTCPCCGGPAKRETDTMPQWAGSSWYYLRYMDPHDENAPVSKEAETYWDPVDWYNGGMEHTTLHLLYSRFWHKFLYDIGVVHTKEPYAKRTSHGMILGQNPHYVGNVSTEEEKQALIEKYGNQALRPAVKMSKSLGNGIDPLEVIDKYGADALRFFLATGNTPGNDMRYSDKRVEACANFANKLWNASRYVHMNIDDHDVKNELPKTLTTEDKWIVSTLNTVAKEVNENLEKFELGIAVQKIYEFIWDCYCDWYIELVKTRLSSDGEDAQNARQVLLYVLDQILRLLHPFMPYITEEIWQTIPHEGETVMLAKYPEYNAELDYPEASDEMKKIMDAIRAIRNRRAEMNVPPSRKAKVYVATKFADTFKDGTQFIQKLASASEVEVAESFEIEGAVNIVTADAKIYIPMDELVDREKELARLNKELEQVKKRLAQSEGKLNNQGFVAKAPEAVIEKVKGQAAKEREQIALIEAAIAALK